MERTREKGKRGWGPPEGTRVREGERGGRENERESQRKRGRESTSEKRERENDE